MHRRLSALISDASLAALCSLVAVLALSDEYREPLNQSGGHDRPNIVLILADDLGFSDTAPYGSEINTPTLSALAAAGVTFTNYHTATMKAGFNLIKKK